MNQKEILENLGRDHFHPAIAVVDKMIKERELRSKASGYYNYYSCSCHEVCQCCVCGEEVGTGKESSDIKHLDGCAQKEWEDFKLVNDIQLKLLRDYILDCFEIRRMLCVQNSEYPYMDDGEAQDSSTYPVIDYIRDSAQVIRKKRRDRMINALKE